jgi:prefoldin subunit 5
MIKVLCENGPIAGSIKYHLEQLNGETEMLHKRVERLTKEKAEMREEINFLHKLEEKARI